MRAVAPLAAIALVALCVLRRDELAGAVGAVPPATLSALVALHVLSLWARSEAWRLSPAAIGNASPPRMVIHAALSATSIAAVLVYAAALWLALQDTGNRIFVHPLRLVHHSGVREEDAVRAMVEPGVGDASGAAAGTARFEHGRHGADDPPGDAEALSRARLRRLTEAVYRVIADERQHPPRHDAVRRPAP